MMKVMARHGERITCEAGHVIGIFERDVHDGREYALAKAIHWLIKEPPDDDTIVRQTLDCQCGAPWCRVGGPGIIAIHVEQDWRP